MHDVKRGEDGRHGCITACRPARAQRTRLAPGKGPGGRGEGGVGRGKGGGKRSASTVSPEKPALLTLGLLVIRAAAT
jgi:hypothetical protein